jgi:uncharacterized protein (TIGR02145 family)
MAENLQTEFTPDGQKLEGVTAYEKDERHVDVYGRLYTHEAALKACPKGWRLPTQLDYERLFSSVMSEIHDGQTWTRNEMGLLLRQAGNVCWRPSDNVGLDPLGFEARPAGVGSVLGGEMTFSNLGEETAFWSHTATGDGQSAWAVGFRYDDSRIQSGFVNGDQVLSVRYVQDSNLEED